jgi:hypothetical protein
MIGSIWWNFIAGLSGALLVFLVSFGNNPLRTAGTRAMYSFIILFAVAFAVRWLLSAAADGGKSGNGPEAQSSGQEAQAESDKGRSIDFSISAEDDAAAAFTPLSPPKLASVKALDPERLANAARHMSEQ